MAGARRRVWPRPPTASRSFVLLRVNPRRQPGLHELADQHGVLVLVEPDHIGVGGHAAPPLGDGPLGLAALIVADGVEVDDPETALERLAVDQPSPQGTGE